MDAEGTNLRIREVEKRTEWLPKTPTNRNEPRRVRIAYLCYPYNILFDKFLARNAYPTKLKNKPTASRMNKKHQIELEQETDGRWIAEIEALSDAMVYGDTREQAIMNIEVLALRILADRLEHGEVA
jgi:predicted RNase H-like HicB family nuclease